MCCVQRGLTHWVTHWLQSVLGMAAAGFASPGTPRFQKRGAQRLQSHPSVWGRQGHCPLARLQKQASAPDGHLAGTVPWGSQLQPGERKGLTGRDEREPTRPPWDAPTHSAYTIMLAVPGAQDTGLKARPAVSTAKAMAVVQTVLTAPTLGVAGSRIAGMKYCCCTGRASMDSFWGLLLAKGAQSSQRNSGHSRGPGEDRVCVECLEYLPVALGTFSPSYPARKSGLTRRAEDRYSMARIPG